MCLSNCLPFQIPQLFYSNLNTPEDWGYKTQPQKGACRSYRAKGCAWPRGKTLGGSSSINAMFYVRGNKVDYDEWAAQGNKGWSYEDVLPYFKKSENYLAPSTDETYKYHSQNGYLNVTVDDNMNPFEHMIIKAAMELGFKNSTDINGDSQMGVIRASTTSNKGMRQGTAANFLNSVKDRKNLHVMKNTHAIKILFEPGTNTVSGILLNKDGKEVTVNIRKELIVSAGAINSPQLLMLSGIGPRKHLKEMNIEVNADLPVGENLQDHAFHPLFYTLPGDENLTSLSNIIQMLFQSIVKREGPLSDTSPHRVISFYNTTDPNSESPDIQSHYVIFPPSIYNLLDVLAKHDLNEQVQAKFKKINKDKFTMFVYTTLLKPKSKGKIILKSKNPFDHPLIYANYFDHPEDIETVIKGIQQHALKLGKTKAFQELGFTLEWLDIDACRQYDKESAKFLDCMVRELTFSLYHPTSTVKMGPDTDNTAVVDHELRVRNVKGIRVVDASIMPSVVRGNTNAPCIMIGEKGADMIKNYWLKKHTEL